jgi:pilus assembly protein CpaB
MALNMVKPPQPQSVLAPAPIEEKPTRGYFVAKQPLRVGTLTKENDVEFKLDNAPPPDATTDANQLRGALVRQFIAANHPITTKDILSPRDRGFLASVLQRGKRAVSIEVDAEAGAANLWPGDHVDVVLTQQADKDRPMTAISETILRDARVVAVDQGIAQGQDAPAQPTPINATVPKKHTITLELSPADVQIVAVARRLGSLSLTIRPDTMPDITTRGIREANGGAPSWPAVEADGAPATTEAGDVSPRLQREREHTTVRVYAGGKVTEYQVLRQGRH